MPDFSQMKLGRRDNPAGTPNLPRMRALMNTNALPLPPPAAGYGVLMGDWGMLGNDSVGDCYPAAIMHSIMSSSRWCTGKPLPITDAQTISLYSEIAGYNPADPSTDIGCMPAQAINYWQNTGVDVGTGTRNVLSGAAGLHTGSWTDLCEAIAWCGMALVSWQLPVSAQRQSVWDVVPNDGGVWGGHETLAIFYNPHVVRLVTWGMEMNATRAFVERYMTGGIMPLNKDLLRGNGVDPEGLNWAQISASKAQLSAAIG